MKSFIALVLVALATSVHATPVKLSCTVTVPENMIWGVEFDDSDRANVTLFVPNGDHIYFRPTRSDYQVPREIETFNNDAIILYQTDSDKKPWRRISINRRTGIFTLEALSGKDFKFTGSCELASLKNKF